MVALIYLHGIKEPFIREMKEIVEICEFVEELSAGRIEKVVVYDFDPEHQEVKQPA